MARLRGRYSIHHRLFILFLFSMMTLLILVSVLYYGKTREIIHHKISELAEKNIAQTAGLFELLLEGYDSLSKSLNSNFELVKLLEQNDKAHDPLLERTITNIIGSAYYSRKDIVSIYVITNGDKVYSYEKGFAGLVDNKYDSAPWFNKLKQSQGEMIWFGLSEGSYLNNMQRESVFIFGRQLYDLNNYKPIGVLVIETNPSPIREALSNVTISPNSRVYLVDQMNHIVASTGEEPPSSKTFIFDGLPRPYKDEIIVDSRTDELLVAANTTMADWTVFGLTPTKDISAELAQTRLYLLLVIGAVILLSVLLASLISRNISSPLKLLIREMKQVEMGNFRGSVNVKSFEEINSLVSSFNRMVKRMDELIDTITISSISEKNAQLQALQSQVNPHFLYNTLDMIYWMLDERENDRLGKVILALSHMFRYSSDWEEASRTTLRQELDQMRHYLTIIEHRLSGKVTTSIHVEDEWLDALIPKMTLQPIIENAVKSGLEPVNRPGLLEVYAEANEAANELTIVIKDNGIGMDPSVLNSLQQLLNEKPSGRLRDASEPASHSRTGIGLPNVHRRLMLMYGASYGLRLDSRAGEGTIITIVMPLPQKRGL